MQTVVRFESVTPVTPLAFSVVLVTQTCTVRPFCQSVSAALNKALWGPGSDGDSIPVCVERVRHEKPLNTRL